MPHRPIWHNSHRSPRRNKELSSLRSAGALVLESSSDGFQDSLILDNSIQIDIPEQYPFHPPVCTLLKPSRQKYWNWISDFCSASEGKDCMCCTSVLCPDNWCPIKTLLDVYQEYLFIRESFTNIERITLGNIVLCERGLGDLDITPYISSVLPNRGGMNRESEKKLGGNLLSKCQRDPSAT